MPKRKLNELYRSRSTNGKPSSEVLSAQEAAAEQRIARGKKLLNRGLKLAKGFERQKLGRRHKAASQKGDAAEVARLEAEIQALKTLDIATAAGHHLYKTLLKVKTVANHPAFPVGVALSTKPPSDNATINVTARLYNANPTKEAMTEALSGIRHALHIDEPDIPEGKRLNTGDAVLEQEGKQQPLKHRAVVQREHPNQDGTAPSAEAGDHADEAIQQSDWEGFSDDGSGGGVGIDREDLAQYEARIASSSEHDITDDEAPHYAPTSTKSSSRPRIKYIPSADSPSPSPSASLSPSLSPSPSPSPSPSRSPSAAPSPPPRSKAPQARQAANPPSNSTFLPSLTMGGYVSGSESAPSDSEMADLAPRKNRRGQRARQQIWEKKYGVKAAHLSKPQKIDRDKGWDPKRGAQLENQDRRAGRSGRGVGGGRGGTGGDRGQREGPAGTEGKLRKAGERDDEGPLHPSWEAAKKAKEARQTAAFQGKKVVFD